MCTLAGQRREKLGLCCVVAGCFHVCEVPDRQGGTVMAMCGSTITG